MLRLPRPLRCLSGLPGHSIRHSQAWRLNVFRKGRGLRPQRCTRPAQAAMRHGGGASSNKSWGEGSSSAAQLTTMIISSMDLPSLMRLVEQHSTSFNEVHAAAALAKAPKLVRKGQAQTDAVVRGNVKQLVCIAQQHLPASGTRQLANMLWAVARLGYRDEQFVRQIIAQASSKLRGCNPQNLSNMALALATLGVEDPAFMQRLLQEASGKLQDFNPQDVANLVWALGKLRVQPDNPGFIVQLLSAAQPKLQQFTGQGLSNTAMGLAWLRHHDPDFMQQLLAASGPTLTTANCQNLSNTALALAMLNHNDAPFIDGLLQQAALRLRSFNYQDISNTLWSLRILDHDAVAAAPTVEALLRAVGERQSLGAQGLVPANLSQVYQYMVTAEVRGHISDRLQQEGWYQRLRRAGQSAWAQRLESFAPPSALPQVLAIIPQLPGYENAQPEERAVEWLLRKDVALLRIDASRRVAVTVTNQYMFMSNAPNSPVGPIAQRQRMLQEQGWELVSIPDLEWNRLGGDPGQQYQYLLQRFTRAGA